MFLQTSLQNKQGVADDALADSTKYCSVMDGTCARVYALSFYSAASGQVPVGQAYARYEWLRHSQVHVASLMARLLNGGACAGGSVLPTPCRPIVMRLAASRSRSQMSWYHSMACHLWWYCCCSRQCRLLLAESCEWSAVLDARARGSQSGNPSRATRHHSSCWLQRQETPPSCAPGACVRWHSQMLVFLAFPLRRRLTRRGT